MASLNFFSSRSPLLLCTISLLMLSMMHNWLKYPFVSFFLVILFKMEIISFKSIFFHSSPSERKYVFLMHLGSQLIWTNVYTVLSSLFIGHFVYDFYNWHYFLFIYINLINIGNRWKKYWSKRISDGHYITISKQMCGC